jgi:hypothetical protein
MVEKKEASQELIAVIIRKKILHFTVVGYITMLGAAWNPISAMGARCISGGTTSLRSKAALSVTGEKR